MGGLGVRHNEIRVENKKAAPWLGGFLFEFLFLSGASGFDEPPMCVRFRDQKGHGDGNKHNKGYVGHANGREAGNRHIRCQPLVLLFSVRPGIRVGGQIVSFLIRTIGYADPPVPGLTS